MSQDANPPVSNLAPHANAPSESDARFLRLAIACARSAQSKGNAPFGAILVDGRGYVVLEGENVENQTKDCTAHAEAVLLRDALKVLSRSELSRATLYASAEPCAMCAGAVFWSGIGRIVFGASLPRMHALGTPPEERLPVRCADLLSHSGHTVVVEGPFLEEEALSVFPHAG